MDNHATKQYATVIPRTKRIQQIRSKKRIVIEHTICQLKKYRILAVEVYLETNQESITRIRILYQDW